MADLSFKQTFANRVEIGSAVDGDEATYRFEPSLPKPAVHPIFTPLGSRITGFEMSDHVWHRGLWFTIKFINGTNFWEETGDFGIQQTRSQPRCELLGPDSMRISHELDWSSAATGTAIRESRQIVFRREGDLRMIDWSDELLATKDLLLDRTPYTTWGGYSGLAFRGSRELHDVKYELPSGELVPEIIGQSHDWMIMRAKTDGGPNRSVSIAAVDHPGNPRSPTPWYCRSANGYNFWNAAFLFHEPMRLGEGQSLQFRYRVIYRDGNWAPGEFAALAEAFGNS